MKIILERGKIMKKKKGFTLIELLAVIVILAIIALIAVPVVMNIISKANKSAFKDSAYGILKAGENYYMNELLDAEGMTDDKMFDFSKDISELEINGSKPTGGSMIVRKDGKISLAITNGKHCVTKGFEDEDIQISDDISNCNIPNGTLTSLATTHTFRSQVVSTSLESDGTVATATTEEDEVINVPACITNKTKCEAGTPVAVEVAPNLVYKFYVLNDDTTKNEITLIMNRNLYSSTDENNGNVAWVTEEDYEEAGGENWDWIDKYESLRSGNSEKGPLTALAALEQRTSDWTNIPKLTIDTYEKYDFSSKTETLISLNKSYEMHARLPRLEELTTTELGCVINSDGCKNWLYEYLCYSGDNNTYGYWTSTANSFNPDSAWNVGEDGQVYATIVNDLDLGLRPVITLSK